MITICKVCGQSPCPSGCPEYSGARHIELGHKTAECFVCGCNIFEHEKAFFFSGRAMCTDCADYLVNKELSDFFLLESTEKFMLELGAKGQAQ